MDTRPTRNMTIMKELKMENHSMKPEEHFTHPVLKEGRVQVYVNDPVAVVADLQLFVRPEAYNLLFHTLQISWLKEGNYTSPVYRKGAGMGMSLRLAAYPQHNRPLFFNDPPLFLSRPHLNAVLPCAHARPRQQRCSLYALTKPTQDWLRGVTWYSESNQRRKRWLQRWLEELCRRIFRRLQPRHPDCQDQSFTFDDQTTRGRCGKRIIGGHDCDDRERLYYVRIQSSNYTTTSHCGGSLIHPEWILTATHCWESENLINILMLKVHPRRAKQRNHVIRYDPVIYTDRGQKHDIMLLKLRTPVKDVSPAQLQYARIVLKCATVQLAGEGGTTTGPNYERDPNAPFPTHLQCVNVNVVQDTYFRPKCGNVFLTEAPNKDICYVKRLTGGLALLEHVMFTQPFSDKRMETEVFLGASVENVTHVQFTDENQLIF
ncbi:hypothetical protein CCH79_00001327 [Gambusia affinis]|uniref:Peptidase S1 domain-containing protein n=1 Tax=Gambusia affinis TaxID=33528 RepID=A0A315VR34_GAMAF|nr:hypothetical protein CCH79_00001327 [Gambusia affinis]